MPREMNPSVVYIVKGEGVRDNSWELQQPPQPVLYTNPPLEQLDSVPTPLGSDLSIRIFEKGTKPVPDYLPSSAARPPATSVVAAQAAPVSSAGTLPAKISLKTPSPVPPTTNRPSSAVSAPASSAKAPKPVVRASAPSNVVGPVPQQSSSVPQQSGAVPQQNEALPQQNAALPQQNAALPQQNEVVPPQNAAVPQQSSQTPPKPPRLRNFRRPFALVIADPTKMPGLSTTRPAAVAGSSSQQQAQQPVPAQTSRLPQPPLAQKATVQGRPPAVSAPTAVPVSAKATLAAAPSTVPKKPSLPTERPGVPVPPTLSAPDVSPMEISPPKPRPPAPVIPSAPVVLAQKQVLSSPPKAVKGAPPIPELPIPGLSSPTKTRRKPQQVTSPSAFGRWKTSSPLSPNDQRSPPLPSPTKRLASAAEEKSRAKPWDKHKGGKDTQTSFEVQRKAMDTIVAKTLARQSKHTKALPPLVPLTPPASRPSQPGPVSPKVLPAKAPTSDALSKRPSPSLPKPREPAEPIPKESQSVKDARQQPRRSGENPTPATQQRRAVDVRMTDVGDDVVKSPVKAPAAHPVSRPKEPVRKVPTTPPKRSERNLLEKKVQRPSNAVARGLSAAKPNADPSSKVLTVKPSAATSTPSSLTEKHRVQSTKAAAGVRAAASPRSSIDGYEIGTTARPIVTKEDQEMARRKREAAASAAPKPPRPSEQAARRKASSSGVLKAKGQRASNSVAGPGTLSVPKAPSRAESNDLFSIEVQEAMRSAIEQVVRIVRHYKQRFEISNRDEMKSNKKRILRFIQTHLEDAVPALRMNSTTTKAPSAVTASAKADGSLRRQSSLTRKESANAKENLQHMDLSEIRVYEMFIRWRRHLEQGDASLQTLASEAKQLRQRVSNLDPDILHLTAPELLRRLGELRELTFSIRKLSDRLSAGRENNADTSSDKRSEEFKAAYRTIMSAARWVKFLSDQTSLKKRKLHPTPAEAAQFAMGVYDALLNESSTSDGTVSSNSIVKAMRDLKPVLGPLAEEGKLDGESLFEMIVKPCRQLGLVCKAGKISREQGTESAAAPSPPAPSSPDQDRAAPRSPTVRSEPIPRRPRHEDRSEVNQESRSIRRMAQDPSAANAGPSNAAQKPSFESRGRARTQNGSSASSAVSKLPMSPKSLPVVPRRPPKAEAPEGSASVPSSQAGPSTQRSAPGSLPRWMADRPNLRTLMQKSPRPVEMREDKSRDSLQAGTKRKADGQVDQNGSDPDARQTKKRRVKFAPVLVQGEQSTPYSFAALQSLFSDGYDLLGDTTELQKTAVEERSSQLSRGSVIALFGFIRSYLTALKAEKDRQHCQRPVWVKLPYTPSMKRDILRFMERRGNGLRSAPGPS